MKTNSLKSLFEINYTSQYEVLVFTDIITNRLKYVLDFIFKRVWQKNYLITQDADIFKNSDKLKINYSKQFFDNAINILPVSLLNSKGIDKKFSPKFNASNDIYYHEDIFAKTFYFLSRYEEWQKNYKQDIHHRFEVDSSAFRDQIHIPIVDESIALFKKHIQKHNQNFNPPIFYKEIYTFDLDNILAFKGKSVIRNTGAFIKHLLKREYLLFKERIKVLQNKKPDPFEEVYHFIESVAKYSPVMFFVLCRSDNSFDRAASIHHPDVVKTLNWLKSFANIGLHPSYYSFTNKEIIRREKFSLEKILQTKIIASRQHYLRMDISVTPKLLLEQGIYYDFTMGFASKAGFRAGTSYPFYYYDFEKEEATDLLFVPFSVMDGAYFNYQNIDIESAIEEIDKIKNNIKKIGGYFIPLFHEITLSPLFTPLAHQWRKVFIPN